MVCTLADDGKDVLKPGLYLQAFCYGIEEALAPYHKEIVQLESRFLSDPHCSLIHVLFRVTPYGTLFLALNTLIREVCGSVFIELLKLLDDEYQVSIASFPFSGHNTETTWVSTVTITVSKLGNCCR